MLIWSCFNIPHVKYQHRWLISCVWTLLTAGFQHILCLPLIKKQLAFHHCKNKPANSLMVWISVQSYSWRHPALHVSDVSLQNHTWFKWLGCDQPSAELDEEMIVWISCGLAGCGRLNVQVCLGTGLKSTGVTFLFAFGFFSTGFSHKWCRGARKEIWAPTASLMFSYLALLRVDLMLVYWWIFNIKPKIMKTVSIFISRTITRFWHLSEKGG